MAETIPSLWPEGITPSVLTPLAILRRQANALEQVTSAILAGRVNSLEVEDVVEHQLDIVSPVLGYEHRVLKVRHLKEMVYPAKLYADMFHEAVTATDDEELIKSLAEVLRSSSVKAVILSLIARSNEQRGVSTAQG